VEEDVAEKEIQKTKIIAFLCVQNADWLDIHLTVGSLEKCRRTALRTEKADKPAQWTPCILDEKNAAAGNHVLKRLISLHNEHPISVYYKIDLHLMIWV
jgi:hypothetical protein